MVCRCHTHSIHMHPSLLMVQNLETRHSLVNLQENCDDIMASVKSSISCKYTPFHSHLTHHTNASHHQRHLFIQMGHGNLHAKFPSLPPTISTHGETLSITFKRAVPNCYSYLMGSSVTRSERSNWEARNGIVVSEQEGVSTPFLTNTTRTRIKDDADIYFPLTLVSDNLNPIIGLDVYNDSLRSPLIIDSLSKRGLLVSTMFTTDLDGQTANLVRFVLPVSLDASDTVLGRADWRADAVEYCVERY
ncbi:hypothetical protein BC829DRAFT_51511 [Chytridium lagenaria]|nr:hypothetical protein BC829DRAFT_51511 [Chytridium lagenaria]